MDSEFDSPLTYSGIPPQTECLTRLLQEVELSPPSPIPTLSRPAPIHLQAEDAHAAAAARALLIQNRTSQPNYKDPREQKLRNVFRSASQREKKYNDENWVFTRDEVGKTFDKLLSQEPLPELPITQALLAHAGEISLNELWLHFKNAEPQPTGNKLKKSLSSSSSPPTASDKPTWLNHVTSRGSIGYVLLLCQLGADTEELNEALGVALSTNNLPAVEVLLRYGAIANGYQDMIRERIRLQDVSLSRLLISAPAAMSDEVWRYCIEADIRSAEDPRAPEILLLCLSHRPEVADDTLLLRALKYRNLKATAIILAYSKPEVFRNVRHDACVSACKVPDNDQRYRLLKMLREQDFLEDGYLLSEELLRNVRARHLPLIKLLVEAAVGIDREPHNAIYHAISNMDLEVIALIEDGNLTAPITLLLGAIPWSAPESDVILLLDMLAQRGSLTSERLDQHLINAVAKGQTRLTAKLLEYGASVDYSEAQCVKQALETCSLGILNILLQESCSASILSSAIPTAMAISSWPNRLLAVHALAVKGVEPEALGLALQVALSEAGEADMWLIKLLVEHQAPVDGVGNGKGGPFLVAVQRGNLDVLKLLCEAKPALSTLSNAVLTAWNGLHDHGYKKTYDLIQLFLDHGAAGSSVNETLLAAAQHDTCLIIVRLLISNGADPNYATGQSFVEAIEAGNTDLFQLLCTFCPPSQASLERLLFVATDTACFSLETLERVLSCADAAAALNAAWTLEKIQGNPNIGTILPCLLNHGLDVNLRDGELIGAAVHGSNVDSAKLLDTVLGFQPSPRTILGACLAVAGSRALPPESQLPVLERLLIVNGGMAADDKAELLRRTVAQDSDKTLLPQLLLSRNTRICSDTMKTALKASSAQLFVLLVHNLQPAVIVQLFDQAVDTDMDGVRRYWMYKYLLGHAIPKANVSNALVRSLSEVHDDLSLQKLLLQHGAMVGHKKCKAFALALAAGSVDDVRLLSLYITDDKTASMAFDLACEETLSIEARRKIYDCFSQWNVRSESVQKALLQNLESTPDKVTVNILLEKGANPDDNDGKCIALAVKARDEAVFRCLIRHATPDIVLKVLIAELEDEQKVTWWFTVCLKEKHPQSMTLRDEDLLFQCMTKFPRGSALAKLLVENAVPVLSTKMLRLCPEWEPEPCSPIIWALFATPRVENDVIFALLSRCDLEVATYKTPKTNISAAFACLLDKTRIPVLEQLLRLYRDHFIDFTTPGPVFSQLASYPQQPTADIDEDLPLDLAALYLGNLDAYRLVGGGDGEDDNSLHLAAWLALPDFVEHLLDRHDPNHKSREFDGHIPLTMACQANENSWSMLAKGDFRARQRKTMKLLAPQTRLDWKSRGRSVLHIALEQGIEVTEMMIEALNLRHDRKRDDRYLYIDRDGLWYSPHQWLTQVYKSSNDEEALIRMLNEAGLKSRYFRIIEPGKGTQPPGHHGAPRDYNALRYSWGAHSPRRRHRVASDSQAQNRKSFGPMDWHHAATGHQPLHLKVSGSDDWHHAKKNKMVVRRASLMPGFWHGTDMGHSVSSSQGG